jgi:hypothetical protein
MAVQSNVAVFGVVKNAAQADKAVSRLTSAGFSNSDTSLLSLSVEGLLASTGIPDSMVQRYERCVQTGSILILVRCANSLEIDRAHIILEENGAENIFSHSEPVTGTHGIDRR